MCTGKHVTDIVHEHIGEGRKTWKMHGRVKKKENSAKFAKQNQFDAKSKVSLMKKSLISH